MLGKRKLEELGRSRHKNGDGISWQCRSERLGGGAGKFEERERERMEKRIKKKRILEMRRRRTKLKHSGKSTLLKKTSTKILYFSF